MIKIVLATATAIALVGSLAGGVASAASSSAVCGFAPGEIHSLFARETDGANAGPHAEVSWGGAPGTPNAPGQAVRQCI